MQVLGGGIKYRNIFILCRHTDKKADNIKVVDEKITKLKERSRVWDASNRIKDDRHMMDR